MSETAIPNRSGIIHTADNDCWASNTNILKDSRFDPVRAKMRQKVVDGAAPSFAGAVAVEGKLIWQGACGWADREGNRDRRSLLSGKAIRRLESTWNVENC